MSNAKVTTADLAKVLQKKAKITEDEAKKFVNAYFNLIAEGIKAEDDFFINKFGTFKKQLKKGRTGRNPSTGEAIKIPSRYNVIFNAASNVAKRVNKPYANLKAKVIEEPIVVEKEKPVALKEKIVVQEKPIVVQEKTQKKPTPKKIVVQKEEDTIPEIEEPIAFIEKPVAQKKTEIIKVERKDAPKAAPQTKPKLEPQKSVTLPATSEPKVVREIIREVRQPIVNNVVPPITQRIVTQTEHGPKVSEQVIERQVIREQIIEQQINKQSLPEESSKLYRGEYNNTNTEADEGAVARCWFIAGIAVVCTIIVVAILFFVIFGSQRDVIVNEKYQTSTVQQQISDLAQINSIMPNAYEEIATLQYGEPKLWPYIYEANRLKYTDPDYNIKRRNFLLPRMPDKVLDAVNIEQAAIDAYRMYKIIYNEKPTLKNREKYLKGIRVLAETEKLMPGFISRYELSFSADDVALARKYLNN